MLHQHQTDLLVSSHPVTSKGIITEPFLEDWHYLSVPKEDVLAKYEKTGVYISEIIEQLPMLHYLDQSDDSFCLQFIQYFAKHYPDVRMQVYTDYFLYIQKMRDENVITISTRMARQFRNDGSDRVLVPLLDEGLKMQYYLNYRKEDKKRLSPILNWQQYVIPED